MGFEKHNTGEGCGVIDNYECAGCGLRTKDQLPVSLVGRDGKRRRFWFCRAGTTIAPDCRAAFERAREAA